jgi:hypothetical protein
MLYLLFGVQISRAILGQDQKLRLPKFLEEEEKSPEATLHMCETILAAMTAVVLYNAQSFRQASQRWLHAMA